MGINISEVSPLIVIWEGRKEKESVVIIKFYVEQLVPSKFGDLSKILASFDCSFM